MNILQQIIAHMNKEEVRHLKLFMSRTNAGDDRKDIELFDFIRTHGEHYDETKIQQKLYRSADKNALYRLKNRLLEDIGKSISLQYHDNNEFSGIVHLLLLARVFLDKGQHAVARYYLSRAERKAVQTGNPELADLAYSEFIRISQETLEINPAEYIRKRKKNLEALSRIREIDDVLAEVVYKMRTTQNFTVQDYKIVDALRKKVQSLSRTKAIQNSTQLRFKVYHSISRILLQKQDYKSLEKYLSQTKEEFESERLFTRQTHDALLQMLTYLANAQFKNGKHQESLATAEELKIAMQQFGGLLHDKYLFFYYNILVMNYSISDRARAIEILTEVKELAVIKKLPFYIVFVYLNLAVLNFDGGNYKQAVRALIKLTMEPGYPSLDVVLRMKIAVAELAMRYEVGDVEVLERRIDQVRKDFSDQLKLKEGKKQKEVVDLVEKFSKNTNIVRDKTIQKKIETFLNSHSSETGSEDVINYHTWLGRKRP